MSVTLNEIAYNIRNKLEGGRSHHNTYKSIDQIKFNIEIYRALFLRRDIIRHKRLREFEQSLNLKVTRTELGESDGLNLSSQVLKSDFVPNPVRLQGRDGITFVSLSNRKRNLPIVDYYTVFWSQYNKYTNKEPRAFYMDNHIYVFGDNVSEYLNKISDPENSEEQTDKPDFTKQINKIYVRGIFEKPSDVILANNEIGIDQTNVDDQPYPLSTDMVQRITEGILSGDLSLLEDSTEQLQSPQTQQQPVIALQP